jgi:hypothetical protein
MINYNDLSAFTQGYVDAIFFTFDDNLAPDLGFYDLSEKALAMILIDCTGFELLNKNLLEQAGTPEQNGHDFWLTRNHHGAGFWDRGYTKEIAGALTDAAHKYKEQSLIAGDDGLLYLE